MWVPLSSSRPPLFLSLTNQWSPVRTTTALLHGLNEVIMKCFGRLVKSHICSSLTETFDPFQFVCRPNRSTDGAVTLGTHCALCPTGKRQYICENALNLLQLGIQHHCSLPKLADNALESICSWIISFMTGPRW